jgi:hypothetical protein
LRFLAARGEAALIRRAELTREFPEDGEASLALLSRRDLIEPADGGYRFPVEMVRRWFTRPA